MVSPETAGLSDPSERLICGRPITGWCITRSIRPAATAVNENGLLRAVPPGMEGGLTTMV